MRIKHGEEAGDGDGSWLQRVPANSNVRAYFLLQQSTNGIRLVQGRVGGGAGGGGR